MTHIYDAMAPILGAISAIALLTLVVLILLGSARKFWVVLLFVSWELLATVGLTIADLLMNGTVQTGQPTLATRNYARIYWTNTVIEDLLRFVLVTVLIYKVASDGQKPMLRKLLTGLVIAMVTLPFVLFNFNLFPYPKSAWFNSTSQLLNFAAAILNLMLWTLLLQSRKRDPQLVAVSIGLGILVTGTAVALGLRHFVPAGAFTAVFNLFLNLVQLSTWLIWCRAFWPERKPNLPAGAVPSS